MATPKKRLAVLAGILVVPVALPVVLQRLDDRGPSAVAAFERDLPPRHPAAAPVAGIVAAGDGWSLQPSGTSNRLNGVSFPDANNGWAVGAAGMILHTADGGATWSVQPSGTTHSLTRVQFLSSGIGWVVGANGTILFSDSGGSSWTAQSSGTSSTLRALSFADRSQGWAVGDSGTILHTTDSGNTWTTQPSGTSTSLGAVSFGDGMRGFVGGDGGLILSTEDGGKTWSRQIFVIPETASVPFFQDARFLDGSRGIFAGFSADGATLLATADGGGTWSPQNPAEPPTALLGLARGDALHYWGVGTGGYIVASEDEGITWSSQPSPTGADLHGVSFVNPTLGWAVGSNGTILKTTTGGH
jgi:photosystem II stability/assembly factor-like uncharacterized protein